MIVAIPPKKLIAQSFSRRAVRYRSSAFIQRHILKQCVELMQETGLSGRSWLDAGCGADLLGELLEGDLSALKLFRTDLAFGSLKLINAQKTGTLFSAQSDMEYLPFKTGTFDGVLVSSVLHWLEDPEKGLMELTRVLKQDGKVVFAVFLKGSFFELGELRRKRNLAAPARFIDDIQMKVMVKKCGLEILDFSSTHDVCYFHSAWEILKYLSDIGSTATNGKRFSRSGLIALCDDYENEFGTAQGIPLSYYVGWGIAKKPDI
jgi:ubiquinone/menaquinone biosynthesis C-methylase UbiE